MRSIAPQCWSALLFLGAVAACSGDHKLPQAQGNAAAQGGGDAGAGGVALHADAASDRDPNLGPPPGSMPDTFEGVIPGADATIKTFTREGFGTYLVDSSGRPFYMFENDKGGMSSCFDNCALSFRPAYAPDKPVVAGPSVHQGMISSVDRTDMPRRQLRYNGMPLYYYGADAGHNYPIGQGQLIFSGHWYLVTVDGTPLGKKP